MKSVTEKIKGYLKPQFEFEAYIQKVNKNKITVIDEKVDSLSSSTEIGLGLRIKKGKKIAFVSSTLSSDDDIRELVIRGMEICEVMPEDPFVDFNDKKEEAIGSSYFDKEGISLPIKEKEDIPIDIERRCKKRDKRIKSVRESSFTEALSEIYYENSYGVEFEERGTFYSLIVGALASDGNDSNISYEYRGVRRLKDMDIDDIVEDVVFKTVEVLNPSEIEACTMPVIFFRESSAMLLETFSDIFLGSSLVKDKTFLKGKLGERVFSELITIIDDGTLERGYASSSYDAEGFAKRKNVIVENGVFKGFLHNLYTGAKSGHAPTGNSVRRSYTDEPDVGVTNIYIKSGDKSIEELIDMYERVLLVTDLMGLHTSDPVSGEFSLGVSGIIYEKGKKLSSVRGVTVAGNIGELWDKVVGVGNDIKFYGNVGSPSILVEKVAVGGR